MRNGRIWIAAGLLFAAGVWLFAPSRQHEDTNYLVVVSWGGSFQEAQREVLFRPFTAATGIQIIEETGPTAARVQAMAQSGRAEWDVALMTPADVLRLGRAGYLAKVDQSHPELAPLLPDLDPRAILDHGVGDFFSSKVMAYGTDDYSAEHHPRTWAEFWDVERFPGLRVIDAGDWTMPPIEYALLADGVEPDDLYPLDFERAYASIGRLAPHVLKFSDSPVMAAQALVDGEASLAAVTLGRIAQLKAQGAPVGFEWNQGLMEVNYWVIMENTDHIEAATRFIAFAARPEIQAAMSRLQPLGPSNRRAFEFLAPERARQLPTYPENLERQIFVDAGYWAREDASGKSNAERNAELWREFVLGQ
ncbi:ABC transporter substrate-binding protein [Elongatibacter sediminis]|uniref:ABC transporter substrate-binding protein n=1 Tax=Elongatibacter sediminis TaxID=3119006 RepID=A0AAW9R5Y9_9GAMM